MAVVGIYIYGEGEPHFFDGEERYGIYTIFTGVSLVY